MQAEGGKYIAGMIGYSGDIPPNDEAGHVEFIKSIQPTDLWEVCTHVPNCKLSVKACVMVCQPVLGGCSWYHLLLLLCYFVLQLTSSYNYSVRGQMLGLTGAGASLSCVAGSSTEKCHC